MNISSSAPKLTSLSSLAQSREKSSTQKDSPLLSEGAQDSLALGVVGATGVGAATLAAVKGTDWLPAGMLLPSGFSGAGAGLAGMGMGLVSGAIAGYGVTAVALALDDGNNRGDDLGRMIGAVVGAATGAIAGGASGYFGAESLIVGAMSAGAGVAGILSGMLLADAMGLAD